MEAVNIFPRDNSLDAYTIGFIQKLQGDLDKKLSSLAKTNMFSERNDLGCILNRQGAENLINYRGILTGVLACNPFYKDYKIEDIVSLVKQEINKN